jgi:YjbE family integral membrane protein
MWISVVPVLKVIAINIILSGDNAIIVALVARNLPAHQRRPALLLGGTCGLVMQMAFTLTVSSLFCLPGLRLIGALLLAVVACRLLREEAQADSTSHPPESRNAAIARIAVVNVVMSLDNAVAVAGVGHSDPVIIGFGLLVSAIIIFAFSSIILQVIRQIRWVAVAGSSVLAFTAAEMMWQDFAPILSLPKLSSAGMGAGPFSSDGARWAFIALVVSTCVSSPRWWPGLSMRKTRSGQIDSSPTGSGRVHKSKKPKKRAMYQFWAVQENSHIPF